MKAPQEVARITITMTVTCVLGAAVLGGVYVLTDRAARAAERQTERAAIASLLSLDANAAVLEVRQYLTARGDQVIYDLPAADGGKAARQLAFTLDGRPIAAGAVAAPNGSADKLTPLGRLFVARRDGRTAGFVVEGTARGYKNRIRFLVGITNDFAIAGVRVVEHEEDPGLGAEVARTPFESQFVGRRADDLPRLDVTRDPMPEDWRAALAELTRVPAGEWLKRRSTLVERERERPIYAVTGATISSRALTHGVRATVDHFRRRWALLRPYLEAGT